MKKKLLSVLAISLSLFTVACSSGASSSKGDKDGSSEKKVIGGIVFQEDMFFKLMSSGYKQAAEDLGYEILLSNITNDQTKETENIKTYTSQKVKGIAISPLSVAISPVALQEAADNGVKVAVANTSIDPYPFSEIAYTSDNFEFCKQTGEKAVEFIKANYPADKTVKIGVIQFKTQIPEISAERVNGFFAALDEAGVKYEIVADQDAWLQDVAVSKAGDMLVANKDIDIIFSANDGGTIGTVMAVENAGKAGEVFVFGTDASEQIVDLLKDDNNILQAVTGQDPYTIGYNTVKDLIASIEGTDLEGTAKETNIIPGLPLVRGDEEAINKFMEDLKSKM